MDEEKKVDRRRPWKKIPSEAHLPLAGQARRASSQAMAESLDEPIPGGARLAYVFGSGFVIHLHLADHHRHLSRALLCSLR